jgi:3-deoxy-D-manno-octulosonic-acid transferase
MLNGYDIAWRLVLAALGPVCGLSPKLRLKVAKAVRQRSGLDVPIAPSGGGPCVMIHAVSLGEINATRALVTQLAAARPDLRFLVTVTTDTGWARARELYGSDARVALARYPLDLSGPIGRLLDRQRPAAVVLMELEVWPNFVRHCGRRGIPVLLVNGRVTASSFRGYRLGGPLVRLMFWRLSDVCVQDAPYAERFRALGARPDAVRVTGTMKFDTAQVGDRVAGEAELAEAVGLVPGRGPVWVCGSTGPGEEAVVLSAYRQLLATHPTLRFVIVPRHPERFDAVAELIRQHGFAVVRRSETKRASSRDSSRGPLTAGSSPDSTLSSANPPAVVLGDTMGELRTFYSLAGVVLVGRTLVDLGPRQRGSDMIEPAALGRPVLVGPWTHNFADAVRQFRQADAMVELASAAEVVPAVAKLLTDSAAATAMGARAREVVRAQQGATARHVEVILARLPRPAVAP